MRTEVLTPPTKTPVDSTAVKAHLGLKGDNDNALIETFIATATDYIEQKTSLDIMQRTRRTTLDRIQQHWPDFPPGITYGPEPHVAQAYIQLGARPLISVESIEYNTVVGSDTWTPWDAANWRTVDRGRADFSRIYPVRSWPENLRDGNALRIDYTTGFGDNPNDVPQSLRSAVTLLAAHFYTDREGAMSVPAIVERLIDPHRYIGF